LLNNNLLLIVSSFSLRPFFRMELLILEMIPGLPTSGLFFVLSGNESSSNPSELSLWWKK